MEILQKVSKKIINYFDEHINITFDNNYDRILDNDKFDNEIYSFIEFSGDIQGVVYMGVNHNLAMKMVEYFIGNRDETLKYEALAETLNIVVGLILSELETVKLGGKVNISIPQNNIKNKTSNKYIKFTKLDYNFSIGYIRR